MRDVDLLFQLEVVAFLTRDRREYGKRSTSSRVRARRRGPTTTVASSAIAVHVDGHRTMAAEAGHVVLHWEKLDLDIPGDHVHPLQIGRRDDAGRVRRGIWRSSGPSSRRLPDRTDGRRRSASVGSDPTGMEAPVSLLRYRNGKWSKKQVATAGGSRGHVHDPVSRGTQGRARVSISRGARTRWRSSVSHSTTRPAANAGLFTSPTHSRSRRSHPPRPLDTIDQALSAARGSTQQWRRGGWPRGHVKASFGVRPPRSWSIPYIAQKFNHNPQLPETDVDIPISSPMPTVDRPAAWRRRSPADRGSQCRPHPHGSCGKTVTRCCSGRGVPPHGNRHDPGRQNTTRRHPMPSSRTSRTTGSSFA